MALAMPVLRPKQLARFAATLNSPPLTWMRHSLALRNGTTPGSNRCTSAPSETRSKAPSGRIARPDIGRHHAAGSGWASTRLGARGRRLLAQEREVADAEGVRQRAV